MAKRELNLTTDNQLESYFIDKLLAILADLPTPNKNIGKEFSDGSRSIFCGSGRVGSAIYGLGLNLKNLP